MILAIDIGNTNIVIGCMDDEKQYFMERISTDHQKTALEYAVILRSILGLYHISEENVNGSILSSVVPPLTNLLKNAISKVLPEKKCLVIGPGVKTGLNILIDNPAQLGADLVVAAVAAIDAYPVPSVIVDMGTATTFSIIDAKKNFIGGVILPGIAVSMNSLTGNTSQLPQISLEAPKKVIGTNTIDSMQSGAIYGNASMLDGMIERMEAEVGSPLTVIATGGLARFVIPHCKKEIIYDDDLLIKGLKLIYDKNNR